jgi:hypothetical protein
VWLKPESAVRRHDEGLENCEKHIYVNSARITKVYINNEISDLLSSTVDGEIIPKGSAGPVHVRGSYSPSELYDIIIFNSENSLITVARY